MVRRYDVENYTSISFLLEIDKFYATVVLRFVDGAPFPERMPTVTLSSPYKLRGSELMSVTHTEYPYSPRWSPDDMAARLRTFLINAIQQFRRDQNL